MLYWQFDYNNALLPQAALENCSEVSTDPECSSTGNNGHSLACPCDTSALQAKMVASLLVGVILGAPYYL